jgi:hypothetical protein
MGCMARGGTRLAPALLRLLRLPAEATLLPANWGKELPCSTGSIETGVLSPPAVEPRRRTPPAELVRGRDDDAFGDAFCSKASVASPGLSNPSRAFSSFVFGPRFFGGAVGYWHSRLRVLQLVHGIKPSQRMRRNLWREGDAKRRLSRAATTETASPLPTVFTRGD